MFRIKRVLNYECDINIDSFKSIYVISYYKDYKTRFLLELAGFLKNDIYYNDDKIYENLDYFSKRVYLDFEKKYFDTINPQIIAREFNDNYKHRFNGEIFKKEVDAVFLRNDLTIKKGKYLLAINTNYKLNFCIAQALNLPINILDNVFTYSRRREVDEEYKMNRNYLLSKYTNSFNNELCIIGGNDFQLIDRFDMIFIIGYDFIKLVDVKNDKCIIVDEALELKNRIDIDGYLHLASDENIEVLKNLKKKYKIVSLEKIVEYIE